MIVPRFQVDDKVRVVRILPCCLEDREDLSEQSHMKLLEYLGKTIKISEVDVICREETEVVMYGVESISESFYEQELEWP